MGHPAPGLLLAQEIVNFRFFATVLLQPKKTAQLALRGERVMRCKRVEPDKNWAFKRRITLS